MASSYFFQNFQAKEPDVIKLFGKVAIGASGAPTLDAVNSKGIASIVRTGAGAYTITLDEAYNKFYTLAALLQASSAEDITVQLVSEAVSTSTAPTIAILCKAAAVATDPSDGSTLYLEISLKKTSA